MEPVSRIEKRPVGVALLWLAIVVGVAAGVGGYTLLYADGASYLRDDSRACANCHVMGGHYDAWSKSSHRAVATCNDCHTPDSLVPKLFVKARNGFHHSLAFTTGRFHEPIQITAANREVAASSCRNCHASLVQAIDGTADRGRQLECLHCHARVGHGP